jgi:large subunit ribosomal protein L31
MKKNIHSEWHDDCVVKCACGATFTTGSTLEKIQVDICSKCHPFFTGEMKYVDTQGRVEKFMKKRKLAEKLKKEQETKEKSKKEVKKEEQEAKSFKQILAQTAKEMQKK